MDLQFFGLEPFVCVHAADGLWHSRQRFRHVKVSRLGETDLLTGRNEILIQLRRLLILNHLVQTLIEIAQLRRLRHLALIQHKRRLVRRIPLPIQKAQSIIHQRQIKEQSHANETVPPMSHELRATLGVVPTQSPEHLMVTERFLKVLDTHTVRCPRLDLGVVVFGAGGGHGVVHVVADGLCERQELHQLTLRQFLLRRLLLLQVVLLLEQVCCVAFGFLDLADFLLDGVYGGADLGGFILGSSCATIYV